MPTGHRSKAPCDDCSFRKECARSFWICSAFLRYTNRTVWKPEQRVPTAEATRAALAERARAHDEEAAEEKQRLKRQQRREYRQRDADRVRQHKRESAARRRKDPEFRARERERVRARRVRDPERARAQRRESMRRWYERVKADPIAYAALMARRRQRKGMPAAAPTTTPAGSRQLSGGALDELSP